MHTQPTPDRRVLFAIDKLQQSLACLSSGDANEARLRIKIEEAIETGYQVAYSRGKPRVVMHGNVVRFPTSQVR